jgi:5,10-methylenetetrahydromethanopterin reductase
MMFDGSDDRGEAGSEGVDASSRRGHSLPPMTSGVQFGVWLQPTVPPQQVARWAGVAEAGGLDFVGVTDGQMIWREVYVCLTAAAMVTQRIRLGTWVTNPITRHPAVTASALCSLDELSEGRAFLGIGNGDDSVFTIGKARARLDDLADAVNLIHALSRGERVRRDGHEWTLAAARHSAPQIYWAAANPRSLQYGGRHADGVIHSGWLIPEMMSTALACIAEGEARREEPAAPVARIFNSAVSIDRDEKVALQTARPYAARGLIYAASVDVPGWSEEKRQRLLEQYDYYRHLRPDHAAVASVPDDVIRYKAVAGSPEQVRDLLQMVVDAGYTHVALLPMGDVDRVLESLCAEVLPSLRSGVPD